MIGVSMRTLLNTILGFPKHLTSLWKWEHPVTPSFCALERLPDKPLWVVSCLWGAGSVLSFLCILLAKPFIIPIKVLTAPQDFASEELTDPEWNSPGNRQNWSWNPCYWTEGWGFHVAWGLEPAGSGSSSLESHVILRVPLPVSGHGKLHLRLPVSPCGKVTQSQFWVLQKLLQHQAGNSGVGADLILQVHLLCLFLLLCSIIGFCSIWVIHIVPQWNDTTLCFYAFIIKQYSWKKSPGLPRFICSIYFSQTLFWIKHLR